MPLDTRSSSTTPPRRTLLYEFLSFGPLAATKPPTLRQAVELPGRKSAFRAGFWPDCYREGTEIGPAAGRGPAGGPISVLSR